MTQPYSETTAGGAGSCASGSVAGALLYCAESAVGAYHNMMLDGEFVTLLWVMHAKTRQEDDFVYSSIEMFRAVDGKICEFWHPIHIQETNGVWG